MSLSVGLWMWFSLPGVRWCVLWVGVDRWLLDRILSIGKCGVVGGVMGIEMDMNWFLFDASDCPWALGNPIEGEATSTERCCPTENPCGVLVCGVGRRRGGVTNPIALDFLDLATVSKGSCDTLAARCIVCTRVVPWKLLFDGLFSVVAIIVGVLQVSVEDGSCLDRCRGDIGGFCDIIAGVEERCPDRPNVKVGDGARVHELWSFVDLLGVGGCSDLLLVGVVGRVKIDLYGVDGRG